MSSQKPDYFYFEQITTRWHDNDLYGHVNNVVYYSFFDSTVNNYLIKEGGLDIHNAPIIGVVVESKCQYKQSIAYPELIEVGLRVAKLGNRSVTYELGIFREKEMEAVAFGYFTHVFVERSSNKAVAIPPKIREALARLQGV